VKPVSTDYSFNPHFRRVFTGLRRKTYDPAIFGDTNNEIVVQLFANPFFESSKLFFDKEFDSFYKRHIEDPIEGRGVRFEVRPVAPEMRMWSTAVSENARRCRKSGFSPEDQITATDAAEFFHSVREHSTKDEFLRIVRRACLVADDDMLTYDRLRIFAEDVEGLEPERTLGDIESGKYLQRVRTDSELWVRLSSGKVVPKDIADLSVFINNDPVVEFETEWAFTEQIEAVRCVLQLEQQSLTDKE